MKVLKLLFLLVFIFILSNTLTFGNYNEPDASISISQDILNKFLLTIGEVKSSSTFNISGVKGEYSWIVKNPKIILSKDKARFQSEVSISLKFPPINYTTPAYGDVSIKYNPEDNKIYIKVEKVAFEVSFNILGKKIFVGEVDISKFYQISFTFPGPKPFETVSEVNMPDGSKRKIKIESIPNLIIDEGKIIVGSNINFTPLK